LVVREREQKRERKREREREIKHLSVHQWLRSAIPDSQQPTSPIGFLFLKLPPRPCAVLLVSKVTIPTMRILEYHEDLEIRVRCWDNINTPQTTPLWNALELLKFGFLGELNIGGMGLFMKLDPVNEPSPILHHRRGYEIINPTCGAMQNFINHYYWGWFISVDPPLSIKLGRFNLCCQIARQHGASGQGHTRLKNLQFVLL